MNTGKILKILLVLSLLLGMNASFIHAEVSDVLIIAVVTMVLMSMELPTGGSRNRTLRRRARYSENGFGPVSSGSPYSTRPYESRRGRTVLRY